MARPWTKPNLTLSTGISAQWSQMLFRPKEWALLNWISISSLMIKNKKRITWGRIWIYRINLKFCGNVMNEIDKIIMKYMMRWRGHILKVIKDIQLFHRWHRSRKIRLKKNHNRRWKRNCKIRFKEIRNSLTCTRMTLIKPQINISWSLLFCKIQMMI